MCRVPPVGGESVATWRLSGEVVGSGQCVCTRGECLHRSGAGATSRSHLRGSGSSAVAGSRPQYRQISTDPGVSPDREPWKPVSAHAELHERVPVQGHPSAGAPTWYREGRVVSSPCVLDQGSIQNPGPDS